MKGSKYLIIFKAFPITDLNELTMHLLEVIQSGHKLMKLRTAEENKTTAGGANGMSNTFNNSLISGSLGGPTGTGGGSTNGGGGGGLPGFTANQNMVHGIISSVRGEQGIHRDEVLKQVRNRITQKEALDILEFLSNEGHVFSTIDDDHYSATDSQYT
jgi:replication factor A2